MPDALSADLARWREAGADYRVIELSADRAVVELTTCLGERVALVESRDRDLIEHLRRAVGGAPPG